MFFRRKANIRDKEDKQLLSVMTQLKSKLEQKREIISKSVDPPEHVLYELKLTEIKYLFLLREARRRHNKKNEKS